MSVAAEPSRRRRGARRHGGRAPRPAPAALRPGRRRDDRAPRRADELPLRGAAAAVRAALDRAIRYTLTHATVQARLARTVELGRVAGTTSGDPLAAVDARAADSQQALPPAFRSLISGRTYVAGTPLYLGPPLPGLERELSLRVQSGVASHIRFVAGRPPAPSPTRIRTTFQVVPGLFLSRRVPVTEVALSVTNARQLRMHLGDRVVFTPDNEQVDLKHLPQRDEQPLVVKLVGLFEVKDPRRRSGSATGRCGWRTSRSPRTSTRRSCSDRASSRPGSTRRCWARRSRCRSSTSIATGSSRLVSTPGTSAP